MLRTCEDVMTVWTPVPGDRRAALRPPTHRARPRSRTGEGGFSVIEAAIASAILLIVSIGLLPMFTLSISNNQQGRDSMEITNEARSELERLLQLDFAAPDLTVPNGVAVLEVETYWVSDDDGWVPADEYDDGGFIYHRIVEVRQFGADALDDGLLHPDEAVEGDESAAVNFKEILVQLESAGGIGAPRKQVTLRGVRAV
jgi:hypothetical protein